MRPTQVRSALIALIVASAFTPALRAQNAAVGHLAGSILGPDAKPLANQLVRMETPRGHLETRTDAKGQFRVANLIPGPVTVKVAAPGMADFRSPITVVVNQTSTLNIKLRPQAQQVVEVVAEAPILTVDANLAQTGQITTFARINDLPFTGGGFDRSEQAVVLAPGANHFMVHGTDEYQNGYQVDGVDNKDGNYGNRVATINSDFIDQVQLLSSGVSARYGRISGATVNVTTKSGTNAFEGSVRLELTNPKWNSRGKWAALNSIFGQDQPPVQDTHSVLQSYTFLGPIIKDRLFFAGAYQTTVPLQTVHLTTGPSRFGGVPYAASIDQNVKDLKLDWVVNTSNRTFLQWNEHTSDSDNYGSGGEGVFTSLATLEGLRREKKGFWAVGWTSQLSSDLLFDAKYNDAYSKTGGSGTGPRGGGLAPTWVDKLDHDILDNGFGSPEPMDNHQKTLAATLTWYVNALGQHQAEVGFQGYTFTREGAKAKTPSGYVINFHGYKSDDGPSDLANRDLLVNQERFTNLQWYQPIHGKVDTKVNALYLNDAWVVNEHWSLNLGLRYDHYSSDSTPEGNHYAFDALVPRLSASYDVKGDGRHVLAVSASEYAGSILQGQLGAASVTQSPLLRQYVFLGTPGATQGSGTDALTATGAINWNNWGNAAGERGKDHPDFVSDPLSERNVFVDPNIKAPRTREITLGYRSTVDGQTFSATLIRRWNDRFVDDVWQGNGIREGVAKVVITNDPEGRQVYTGLELAYRKKVSEEIEFGGNFTWSRALGNAGETLNGSSSEANNYGPGLSHDQIAPWGPIPGVDMPLAANLDATYRVPIGKGLFNAGLLASFRGRQSEGFVNAEDDIPAALAGQGFRPTYTRTFPQFGILHQPSTFTLDLQVGFDQQVWRTARAYVKLNISNILNYMPASGYVHYGFVENGSYVPHPLFNNLVSFYQAGRTLQVVTGLRF